MAKYRLHVSPVTYSLMQLDLDMQKMGPSEEPDPRGVLARYCHIPVSKWELGDSVEIVIEWMWPGTHPAELEAPPVGIGRVL